MLVVSPACEAWPEASRGHVRLGEVLEALDHADDDGEQDDRTDRRHGDVPEPPQRARAVELGRLLQMLRDVEDGGEEDDQQAPDPPEAEQDERRLRPLATGTRAVPSRRGRGSC